MSESVYDNYEAGHSSTSLSAALGFALARDMKKKIITLLLLLAMVLLVTACATKL